MIEIRTSSSSQRRGFKRDGVRKVVMRPDGGEVRSDLDVGLGKTVQAQTLSRSLPLTSTVEQVQPVSNSCSMARQ